MNRIEEVLKELKAKAERMSQSLQEENDIDLASSSLYECTKCQDRTFIIENRDGYEVAITCSCAEIKKLRSRFQKALIPDEFKEARFDNYKRQNDTQKLMYDVLVAYLKDFESIKQSKRNSFGYIAKYGEQRIKELPYKERAKVKHEHNNFGLGKTHLQAAAAKHLIKKGYRVLMVSDVTFMEELIQAKFLKDESKTYNDLLHSATTVDVLIWDDIGKSKYSEAKESLYYQIINERYRNHRPIIFSSNEDDETVTDKIGYAASSRIFGMAKDNLYEVEGPDYRVNGDE